MSEGSGRPVSQPRSVAHLQSPGRNTCTCARSVFFLCFLFISIFSHTHAAEVIVLAGTDTLTQSIQTANDGDTLLLSGLYNISTPTVWVNKTIHFTGTGTNDTVIEFASPGQTNITFTRTPVPTVGFVLSPTGLESSFRRVVLRGASGGTACGLVQPQALNMSFAVEVVDVKLQSNHVRLLAGLGPMYSSRRINSLRYGSCSVTPTISNPAVTSTSALLSATTCHSFLFIEVAFNQIMSCEPQKTIESTGFASYMSFVEVTVTETAEDMNRTQNFIQPLRLRFDRQKSVNPTIQFGAAQSFVQLFYKYYRIILMFLVLILIFLPSNALRMVCVFNQPTSDCTCV
eukprot:comp21499_c0_seq1/m.29808 comp21499_c0_seq1/g.29808  ORF comp21499_c0_seq1/g.29808 comp21499_c0_seq1/m.29808 type:complete len:344 (-) comp21499_c0_seq1:301-1332(-)